MTNNKQQKAMKLYTEEQVKEIYFKGVHNGRLHIEGKCSDEVELLIPIELPSDEEIEKANPFVFGSKHLGTRDMDIWELGVRWMRDKIQGGNQ
jgi:hypothetical protein